VWSVRESDFWRPKSYFIRIYPSSNIPNSSDVVILFCLMKKTVISANLFTPEQKLTFNCFLCDSFVNRILGEQKGVSFGSIRLPIFQILRTLWFYFVWCKKNVISANLFTPKQKLTLNCVLCGSLGNRFSWTKKKFYSDLSVFQYCKFLGRCDFISFDEKSCYISQFIYAQTKTLVELRFVWFVSELDFRGPKSGFLRIFRHSNIRNS
jgi:hypothetical protein